MEPRFKNLVAALNDHGKKVRLASLRQLMAAIEAGALDTPIQFDCVNNHIHSTYSFSPYSPTKAIWEAYRAGLSSAGIMDHDSICGAYEFIEAGALVGIATTIGVECRADFSMTPLRGRRFNNPDQLSNAYITLHGIPHDRIAAVKEYFEPIIVARHKRNRIMVDRINQQIFPFAPRLDYERDVLPLSNHHDGGTVTERHLLLALARRLVSAFGREEPLIDFLKGNLRLPVPPNVIAQLRDHDNFFFEYDLLGLLKGEFVNAFYVDATDECPEIGRLISFAKSIDGICAYAYLGDVGTSVTGDKRSQKFEDAYLDQLIFFVKSIGFNAVTYMPSRNSTDQLERLMNLCRKNGLLQISGEDINSPRQLFICETLKKKEFRHLVDTTWALIGHEKAATADGKAGFFAEEVVKRYPDLNERIQVFKKFGLGDEDKSGQVAR